MSVTAKSHKHSNDDKWKKHDTSAIRSFPTDARLDKARNPHFLIWSRRFTDKRRPQSHWDCNVDRKVKHAGIQWTVFVSAPSTLSKCLSGLPSVSVSCVIM